MHTPSLDHPHRLKIRIFGGFGRDTAFDEPDRRGQLDSFFFLSFCASLSRPPDRPLADEPLLPGASTSGSGRNLSPYRAQPRCSRARKMMYGHPKHQGSKGERRIISEGSGATSSFSNLQRKEARTSLDQHVAVSKASRQEL